jgi:hypothetical protein
MREDECKQQKETNEIVTLYSLELACVFSFATVRSLPSTAFIVWSFALSNLI